MAVFVAASVLTILRHLGRAAGHNRTGTLWSSAANLGRRAEEGGSNWVRPAALASSRSVEQAEIVDQAGGVPAAAAGLHDLVVELVDQRRGREQRAVA